MSGRELPGCLGYTCLALPSLTHTLQGYSHPISFHFCEPQVVHEAVLQPSVLENTLSKHRHSVEALLGRDLAAPKGFGP